MLVIREGSLSDLDAVTELMGKAGWRRSAAIQCIVHTSLSSKAK